MPELPTPHPMMSQITPEIQMPNMQIAPPSPLPVEKISIDFKDEYLPTVGTLLLSTASLACRQLDTQYLSALDGEKQLYARIEEISKKEKTAKPDELIELRKQVDDMNLSMLKLKKQRIGMSEELGDILRTLGKNESTQLVNDLDLKKKVELYKNVMDFLASEKKKRKAEDKAIFDLDMKETMNKALQTVQVEKEVAEEQKKVFYATVNEFKARVMLLTEALTGFDHQLSVLASKSPLKYQVLEIAKREEERCKIEIIKIRSLLKKARKEKKGVIKTRKNGIQKARDELKELHKDLKDLKQKKIVKGKIAEFEADMKNVKKNCELNSILKEIKTIETKMSEEMNQRVVKGNQLAKQAETKYEKEAPLLCKMGNVRGFKLFKRLERLENRVSSFHN
ncbi:hypothetical protein EIN_054950 [Entamoeba invadens IP1]|nr:hypothetical protein EIN_054950 [Entamoeba invadens IP1]ELP93200.1 hypothetical protein EIN_054950 [Entamoeba invadens IP1]|eukprot:XP_004259971.1 hypothetical protein EIN_054950 [Entamoeba invadens IP1]